jgi:hypothetical protein
MQRNKRRSHPITLILFEPEFSNGMWDRTPRAFADNKRIARDSAPKRKVLARAFKIYTSAKKTSVAI